MNRCSANRIGGLQVDHQIAIVQPIFRLGIERDKVILLFTFTRHHADIVPPTRASSPETPANDAFGVTSQN